MPEGGFTQRIFGFVTGSGMNITSASGGVAFSVSLSSISVVLTTSSVGRIFIGGASGTGLAPPVGSGSTDAQRVGFPVGATSGQFFQPLRLNISNPSLLAASAETSGQVLFFGIETP